MSRIDDWKRLAACREASPEIFIPPDEEEDEPFYPSAEAHAYCGGCPVRVECLEYALTRGEIGTWGDTTTYQRRQLEAQRDRAKCPTCGSTEMIYENNVQLCLACGVSWPII